MNPQSAGALAGIFALTCTACASIAADTAPAGYTAIAPNELGKHTRGDYDGDGRVDTADFFESDEGALTLLVRRGAAPEAFDILWGGDIASFPYFEVRTAQAGLYQTNCDAYGPNCGGAPATVTLTHDGIIVEGLEDHSRTLYYWADGEFKNVSVRE